MRRGRGAAPRNGSGRQSRRTTEPLWKQIIHQESAREPVVCDGDPTSEEPASSITLRSVAESASGLENGRLGQELANGAGQRRNRVKTGKAVQEEKKRLKTWPGHITISQ